MSACFAVNVHFISSQCKRVYHCLDCFKQISVFCKDTEAVPSTLFEHIVLTYKFLLWCIITTIVPLWRHRNMMWPIYSFWIKSHQLNLEMWISFFILTKNKNKQHHLNAMAVQGFIVVWYWITWYSLHPPDYSAMAEHYHLVASFCMCPSKQKLLGIAAVSMR